MPVALDDLDISIIKSILADGRKPFRQISRETGITTPTVIARYERLVNIGFIKGVLPIFDFEKVESDQKTDLIDLKDMVNNSYKKKNILRMNRNTSLREDIQEIQKKISKGISIKVVCDFCDGPVSGKPTVLKFANIERFFCCMSCKSSYSQKYKGRIESIKRKYEGKSEMESL